MFYLSSLGDLTVLPNFDLSNSSVSLTFNCLLFVKRMWSEGNIY